MRSLSHNRLGALLLCLPLLLFLTCKDKTTASGETVRITYFAFENITPKAVGSINQTASIIEVAVPEAVDVDNLTPTIMVTEGAMVEPPSGIPNNFENEAPYTLTGPGGEKTTYKVIVEKQSDEKELLSFDLPDLFVEGEISGQEVSLDLLYGTDLSEVKVEVKVSETATASIESGAVVNLNEVNEIVVTSQLGTEQTYAIKTTTKPQEEAVRGVWLTNIASNVLDSRDSIAQAMDRLEELNFNTVFLVTFNKTQTPHPSTVLQDAVGDPGIQTQFYPGRDVLQEVIEEAHAKGLKVIAWFEYGFAAQYGDENGGRNAILQAHPEWESRDQEGNVASKNNFYWMNGFHPEVQQFMIDLVTEVVENYDVDGVQGDDRLPAMPTSAGYDDYTVEQYEQFFGSPPPASETNQAWVQWRANIMTQFGKDLFDAVKAEDPECLVTFSPSPYPFSFTNYCQDWPDWVEDGIVQILSPQLYRRDTDGIDVYTDLLQVNLGYASNRKDIFYPGILLRIGDYIPTDEYLVEVIRENRKSEVKGEVFFFYEGVWPKKKVFRALYPGEAIFPF